MTTLKTHFSAAELAAMALPGYPGTKRGMLSLVVRENWPGRKRIGRGGGMEYQPPKHVRILMREQTVAAREQAAVRRPRAAAKRITLIVRVDVATANQILCLVRRSGRG